MSLAENLSALPTFTADANPRDILRAGLAALNGTVNLACSFSIDDVVLIDLLKEHLAELTVFASVRIKGGDSDFGVFDAEVFLQGGIEQINRLEYPAYCEFVSHIE